MRHLVAAIVLFWLLIYNSYWLLGKDLVMTALFGALLLGGTVLALFSVKWVGQYYRQRANLKPKKVLFSWDEQYGLQVVRWLDTISKSELVLLVLMSIVTMILFQLVGTFAVIFFGYAYFTIVAVATAFKLRNTTFIAKEGILRYTPKGLKRIIGWNEIATVRKHEDWFVYVRKKPFPYYYLSPAKEKIDHVFRLILEHKR